MGTKASLPAGAGDLSAAPTPWGAVLKLALAAGLASTLAIGAARPWPLFFLLLEALAIGLGGFSLMPALLGRERLGGYRHWLEAAALGLVGLISHLARVALR